MPYLQADVKKDVDDCGLTTLVNLVEQVEPTTGAGIVTYSIYRLMLAVVKDRTRFWSLALVGGAVVFAVLEFYRRVVAPYEDTKIKENGDVL